MTAPLFNLWAKSDPYQDLPTHCIDVGQVARAVLCAPVFRGAARQLESAFGLALCDGLERFLAFICALHDLGKAHPRFQGKCPELCGPLKEAGLSVLPFSECRGFRHESVSADWIRKSLMSEHHWQPEDALVVDEALRGHHGDFSVQESSRVIDDNWYELQSQLAGILRSIFLPPIWAPPALKHRSRATLLLSGLIVFSDWIASNCGLFGIRIEGNENLEQYALRSYDRARDSLTKLRLDSLPAGDPVRHFKDVWPEFEARPLQMECSQILDSARKPGLLIVEAPMGEGKTEMAIYAALALQEDCIAGFYTALPTAATSNQMYYRVKAFLGNFAPDFQASLRLVHGSSWLVDEPSDFALVGNDELEAETLRWAVDWFRPKRRALLAPFAVGTVDQVLMAALSVKFGFLRWFGLVNRALIIDEVHAYDVYMQCILERLLNWCGCCEIPVVLLSATLPASLRESLEKAYLGSVPTEPAPQDYPLLTYRGLDGTSRFRGNTPCAKRWTLHTELLSAALGEPGRIAETALSLVAEGGALCVLCNTVRSAQAVFRELSERGQSANCEVILFHARFAAGRRDQLEKAVLERFDKRSCPGYSGPDACKRPGRAILVATQVVEQSLDLDFDAMVSEIAPVDLLLQRVGRVHRHERPRPENLKRARLLVALPDEELDWGPTRWVYSPFVLLKTLALLRTQPTWRCPEDFRMLVEDVYGKGSDTLEASGFDPGLIEKELAEHQKELRKMEAQARSGALLKRPSATEPNFLDDDIRAEAEEGQSANPLIASTRLGGTTRTVFALDDNPENRALLARTRSPLLESLRGLHSRKVALPESWFLGASPVSNFEPPARAPKWLGFGDVIWLQDSRWSAQLEGGSLVSIRDDSIYGFVREVDA